MSIRVSSTTACGLSAAALLATTCLGGPARAAEPEGVQIETIVVTANRRSEDMQKVPIAISAITAQQAEKMGLSDPQFLTQAVPGLNWTRQSSSAAPFIRGVGSPSGTVGNEPAVATYIDDVYLPSNTGAQLGYANIDRIEVLKGPQGTLFGRNATGGVVNIHTRDPSYEPSAELKIGYANYNKPSGSIYATTGLSDHGAINVFLYGSKQYDGYGKNLNSGADTYRNWDYGGRVKILLEPSDDTRILVNVSHDKFFTQQGLYFHPAPGTRSNLVPSGSLPPPGRYDTFVTDPYNYTSQSGISAKLSQDLSMVKLVGITSFRTTRSHFQFPLDGAPFANFLVDQDYRVRTWTQELRLISPDDNARLTWIVGGYLYHSNEGNAPGRLKGASFNGGNPAGTAQIIRFSYQRTNSYAAFGQSRFAITPDTHLTGGVRYTVDHRRAKAFGFAPNGVRVVSPNSPTKAKWDAITYRVALDHQVTDDVMVYGAFNRGFRSGVYNMSINPGAVIAPPVNPEYLNAYTAGVKADLWDRRLRVNVEAFRYRYKNLQLSQTVILPGVGGGPATVSTLLTNAASAKIKGVEVEITAIPVDNLTLNAAFSLMDGKYGDFANGQFLVYQPTGGMCTFTGVPGPGLCGSRVLPPNYNAATGTWNLKGNKTAQTPPFSMTLTANYSIPMQTGPIDISATWHRSGDYYADPDNGLGFNFPGSPVTSDIDRQKIYSTLSGSITWTSPGDAYSIRLWGRNLTNTKYWDYTQETGPQINQTPAAPRTYGVTLTARM